MCWNNKLHFLYWEIIVDKLLIYVNIIFSFDFVHLSYYISGFAIHLYDILLAFFSSLLEDLRALMFFVGILE